MKANEAPKKLYINLFKGEFNVSYSPVNNSVEYIRTDAFIVEASEWMKLYVLNHDMIDIFEMEDDFKNYMKGE